MYVQHMVVGQYFILWHVENVDFSLKTRKSYLKQKFMCRNQRYHFKLVQNSGPKHNIAWLKQLV